MSDHTQRYPPIGDYGFLGDCHNWALVSRAGSIDWACFERSGSRSVFARILDWDRGGHCRLWPGTEDARVERSYLPETNVLVTRFHTPDGVLEIADALVLRRGEDEPGVVDVEPWHELVRRVRCLEGRTPVSLDLRPRFDYGTTSVHVRLRDDGVATVVGGADALTIRTDLELVQEDWTSCQARDELQEGDERWLVIDYADPVQLDPQPLDPEQAAERLDRTVAFWRDWAAACHYDGQYRDAVVRSALVLKALTNATTGAIVAAPTTSLPEQIGAERNWDYRYTWIRDAAAHLDALFGLGYSDEAAAFARWLGRTTAGTPDDLLIMYAPDGGRMLNEIELDDLEGYRGSRPVRVGNGAIGQFQLDIYGELVNTAYSFHRHGGDIGPELARLLTDMVDVVADRWQQPDKGLWEVRGAPEHFTSSKMYAWLAMDRLAQLGEDGVIDVDVERCVRIRERIRRYIDRYGVDEDTNAFTGAFGRTGMDASSLLLGIEGYVEPGDERFTSTVERIEDELTENGLVYRYVHDDGLDGEQGAFFWCSFWVVTIRVMRGDLEGAKDRFESLLRRRNDLGLLSEECNPETGELLGNFPQAISHVGLIDAALRIAEAELGPDATDRITNGATT